MNPCSRLGVLLFIAYISVAHAALWNVPCITKVFLSHIRFRNRTEIWFWFLYQPGSKRQPPSREDAGHITYARYQFKEEPLTVFNSMYLQNTKKAPFRLLSATHLRCLQPKIINGPHKKHFFQILHVRHIWAVSVFLASGRETNFLANL